MILLSYNVFATQNTEPLPEPPQAQETGSSVLSHKGEIEYFKALEGSFEIQAVFPQTKWLECDDSLTGNYTDFNCTNRREISKVLKSFMSESF